MKKTILIIVAVVAFGYAGYALWNMFGSDEAVATANSRTLKDSESGDLVEVTIQEKMPPYPHENRKTGKKTLYPTEVCWAGECLKKGGTHVILNVWLGKDGPTYCPTCGSLVVAHNPGPIGPDTKD